MILTYVGTRDEVEGDVVYSRVELTQVKFNELKIIIKLFRFVIYRNKNWPVLPEVLSGKTKAIKKAEICVVMTEGNVFLVQTKNIWQNLACLSFYGD